MKIKIITKYLIAVTLLLSLQPLIARENKSLDELAYCLPETVLRFEVEATVEQFHAGPYAAYAEKYLGIKAKIANSTVTRISNINFTPFSEPDENMRFFVSAGNDIKKLLAFTSSGLVCLSANDMPQSGRTFLSEIKSDFTNKGISPNLTSKSAVLYRSENSGATESAVEFYQKMIVLKSTEAKAKEAADMIFKLREKRLDIITGNTDASYAGGAMKTAIEEINKIEKEYLSLFFGYSDYRTQKMYYDIVPSGDYKKQRYIAFRISDSEGLVSSSNVEGRPCILKLEPVNNNAIVEREIIDLNANGKFIYYRLPALYKISLFDGTKELLVSRANIYQLGSIKNYKISK